MTQLPIQSHKKKGRRNIGSLLNNRQVDVDMRPRKPRVNPTKSIDIDIDTIISPF